MKKIILWLKAMRAPFFSASFIPAVTGAALSSREGHFHFLMLFFTLIIVFSYHAGANLINDYFDSEGSDRVNSNPTPFSGGSRFIQEGILTRWAYLKAAVLAYGIGSGILLGLTVLYGNPMVLVLGAAGILLGITYSATHTYGMGRGWGELAIGLAFGPLTVLGSFILQTNHSSPVALLAGIPVGFLVMGILILNEFPDRQFDQAVGKRNWIVRVGGGKNAVWVYLTVISLAYLTILGGVFWGVFPVKILFAYFTLPLAVWVSLKVWRYRGETREIIPAMAGNISLQFFTGLLITIGLWWK